MSILEEILFPVVDEMSESEPNYPLKKNKEGVLFGAGGLDSMQLVSFVVAVEEAVIDKMAVDIVLADEKAMSRRNSPFRSLGALAEYIDELRAEVA